MFYADNILLSGNFIRLKYPPRLACNCDCYYVRNVYIYIGKISKSLCPKLCSFLRGFSKGHRV